MKKLQKEFTGNYDKVGMNKFVQLRKENGVAMYQRFNTDGSPRSYEVFIVKVIPKGAPLPNGKTVEESYESYPGSAQLVEKVKISAEAKEESIKTGKPNKGRRISSNKKTVSIPSKGTKFTTKFLVTNTGIAQPILFPIIKNWEKSGLIQAVGTVKAEGGKGRPAIEYVVV